jgi:hypothetical protein
MATFRHDIYYKVSVYLKILIQNLMKFHRFLQKCIMEGHSQRFNFLKIFSGMLRITSMIGSQMKGT